MAPWRFLNAQRNTEVVIRQRRPRPRLPPYLANQLALVAPSVSDSGFEYRPCEVEMSDGSVNSYVYVADSVSYFSEWPVDPEDDPAMRSVSIQEILEIRESPYRLPPAIASELLHRPGWGGRERTGGYYVRLEGGRRYLHCVGTGDAVDFLDWPEGVAPDQVTELLSGPVYGECLAAQGVDYSWALYEPS